MLNSGKATAAQIRGWVANRFYYQISIPIKDAAILAIATTVACAATGYSAFSITTATARTRRHRGVGAARRGGGLARVQVESLQLLLPGVRFAVDAYVNFARRAPWPEGVCASLTELFAPEIHTQRLTGWPQYYRGSTRRD